MHSGTALVPYWMTFYLTQNIVYGTDNLFSEIIVITKDKGVTINM